MTVGITWHKMGGNCAIWLYYALCKFAKDQPTADVVVDVVWRMNGCAVILRPEEAERAGVYNTIYQ